MSQFFDEMKAFMEAMEQRIAALETATQKRPRGRPPKPIDPTIPRRPRGRPRKQPVTEEH